MYRRPITAHAGVVVLMSLVLATAPSDAISAAPQSADAPAPSELAVEPTELSLEVGDKATLSATVEDADGNALERGVIFYSRARRSVGVNPAGIVEAYRPGEFTIVAMVPIDPEESSRRAEPALVKEILVRVPHPPAESIAFASLPEKFYANTKLAIQTDVRDRTGASRADVEVALTSSNSGVANFDALGNLHLESAGSTTLSATAEEITTELLIEVSDNPVTGIELTGSATGGRTGDVIWFTAKALTDDKETVENYPIQFATFSRPDDRILAAGASALIGTDGGFVAERSGLHTVVALGGPHSARTTVKITPRNVRKEVEVLGHGAVRDRHTSDLWVWQAPDGKDYAITGTWGADGHAYFWDVSDPASIHLVDTVRVDARTVNDVKISEDGAVAVISREGASNRKNGLVILDVSNPTDGVRVLSRYDDQLNGGVHNIFVDRQHVYALSNGRRYDIINIEDPETPHRVARFELDTPGHGIHDVWVADGIAFSSNWTDGVVAVDVGGGGQGGAPNHPVMLGSYTHPSGWNHAAFPYRSESTGKFLTFAGDESFPYSFDPTGDTPMRAAGWIHIVEWDDWNNATEVARYQVPEAGTHNLWVEDDTLYIGYYNGGLRVVDVSGELRGDLYRQGREIAFWHPYDPKGFIKNAPFAWGPQPYKGNVFVADFNSGLWAVRLVDPEKPKNMGEPN